MRHPNETIDREAYERYQTHLRRMSLAKAKPAKAQAKKPVRKLVEVLTAESTDELNGCCGIEVLSGLGTTPYEIVSAKEYRKFEEEDSDGWYAYTPEDSGITTATKARELGVGADRDVALVATTIPKQKKEIAALKDAGFISLKSFTNPGTRNVVTIWYRKPSA